ncbi:MAG: hypothetical protein MZV70_25410 [Desulfobacterales bacterium]|nr:hypothetical protein [Desulfobacterales bacterium]
MRLAAGIGQHFFKFFRVFIDIDVYGPVPIGFPSLVAEWSGVCSVDPYFIFHHGTSSENQNFGHYFFTVAKCVFNFVNPIHISSVPTYFLTSIEEYLMTQVGVLIHFIFFDHERSASKRPAFRRTISRQFFAPSGSPAEPRWFRYVFPEQPEKGFYGYGNISSLFAPALTA